MRLVYLLAAAAVLAATPAFAQLANLKVITDANPDYSDMESMVRSITSNWSSDAEKMYALFYWDHIGRRQTQPIGVHGYALTDPIRQYNDYGFTMCSTISGMKCSTWNYMGYPCRYFDIAVHTVCDVWYEGKYHHYDNSLSAMYTLPDGVTIAAVPDIGKTLAGPLSGGKEIQGYIGLYHCLNGTSANGYFEGADTPRDLHHIAEETFKPAYIKYRSYYYDQDRGHRYILNLREGEIYTRFNSRQDATSPRAVELDPKGMKGYKADPAYYVPNGTMENGLPYDPELANPRYKIRGNGERTWTPPLDEAHLAGSLHSSTNIKAAASGLVAADSSKPAEAIFKVEGANVITSMRIRAQATGAKAGGAVKLAISTTNGLQWKDVAGDAGDRLIDEVNGAYEVLVRATLDGGATLNAISFNTITEVNGKTQPQLKLGKNTVYVGAGEQTNSIVIWPELTADRHKPYVFEEKNVKTAAKNEGYYGLLCPQNGGEDGYVIFKVDAPTDITSVTYGGRLYNREAKGHIDFLHSFDGGKTWKQDYSLTSIERPWDVIHYETVTEVPPGTRSVLFKYLMNSGIGAGGSSSLYSVRMEVNHKLAAPVDNTTRDVSSVATPVDQPRPPQQLATPVEVTFNWQERQKDYTTIKRSHTQVLDKLPATYTINVGGDDHPIVDSLTVNLKGARPDTKHGYSDGKDVGGEKFVGKWATYGKNFAEGKPYTVSTPAQVGQWDSDDSKLTKLTDGVVGSSYGGGIAYSIGAIWMHNKNPEITVDLGAPRKCAAFRIHTLGWEVWDAIQGQNKDKVEVLTSTDGKEFTSQGFFDFNLRWKDIPLSYMWTDEETFCAHNFMLAAKAPVEARYIKYKVTSPRILAITEVQALESFELKPFELKIALPDGSQNGKAPPKADLSPNAKKWADNEKPTDIGKEQHWN